MVQKTALIPMQAPARSRPGLPGGTDMGAKWLIVADDLTGAADCAIAFAKEGVAAAVGWGDSAENTGGYLPVFSYDTNSRGLTGPDALAKHRTVLAKLYEEGTALFKKIDST